MSRKRRTSSDRGRRRTSSPKEDPIRPQSAARATQDHALVFGKHSFPTVWVLLFWGGLSICIQYVTIEKFSVFPRGKSYTTWANFVRAIEKQITFGPLDGLLVALFLVSTAFLLYKEVRHRVLTDFLQTCFASQRKTLWLLAGCLLLCVRFYFARGELSWAADASHHIVSSWLAAQAIADGQVPIWTFFMGTGSPYLQNYGFAFFYLIGLVDLVCRDLSLSLKLVMAAAHVLSGIGMYYLAASLCPSRRAAFIAGLGYALCFWHTQHVLIMGRFPMSLFYALLPWAFYWIECVVNSPYKMRAALFGGMSMALLNFTHPGYGTYAMVLLGCYSMVRLWSCWSRPDTRTIMRAGVLLFVLGIAFGAYMNVGMYLERMHTMMHDFSFSLSSIPDPTWRHLLGWSNYYFWLIPPNSLHWYGGYLGVSLCVVALAGGVVALWRRDRRSAACWICLILTTLAVFAYRWPLVSTLPLIHLFNASRYLLFLAFFLALAAGIGAYMLLLHGPRSLARSRWCTFLLLVIWVDLFPTTFIHPYYSPGKKSSAGGWPPELFAEVGKEATPFRERDELPNFRAQWIGEGVYTPLRRAHMLYMGATPIVETFHPGELRTFGTFIRPFTDWAHSLLPEVESPEQLLTHPHFDLLKVGFQLLNIRHVIATSSQHGSGFAFAMEEYSPIVVSGRLVSYDEEAVDFTDIASRFGEDLDDSVAQALWIIVHTGLHQPIGNTLSCDRIFVRDKEGERDLGTTPTAQVISHRVDHQQVEMRVAVSTRCYARLAYAHFPYLQVTVDGMPVQPMETAGRFMALPLEAGEHDIVLKAQLSPLRRSLLALSGVLFVGALALVFREHRHLKKKKAQPS